jgi:DNA-binding NarL/FixJ family response regulator
VTADARVLLVDGRVAPREALGVVLAAEPGIDVVGQASSLAEARAQLADVDVALLDERLPDGDAVALIAPLRAASPGAKSLVLVRGTDRAGIARAIDEGATAALDAGASLRHVVEAVGRLHAGETLLALDEVVELLRLAYVQREKQHLDRAAIASLTPREREVLQALADGLEGRAIAERLGVSPKTQRNHVASVLRKLGVHSQLQAVLFALRYGVVDVGRTTKV